MIELDGSQGEGGGQILRTSLTLSLLTGQPFRMRYIRARRSKPGLQPQHRMSVRAAVEVGSARVEGDQLGSQTLIFEPGRVVAGKYHFPIGTAGATSLVMQTVALPLALRGDSPSEVHILGGTHVKASPCFEFLQTTWAGHLRRLDINIELSMRQAGFYPRGGGHIEARIEPASCVRPLCIDLPEEKPQPSVAIYAVVAGLAVEIAERMAQQAAKRLRAAKLQSTVTTQSLPHGPGAYLALTPQIEGVTPLFFAIGERGKPAERVADEAVDALLIHLRIHALAVDEHSADQILLPLAMAQGPSRFPVARVTQHLLTNIDTVRHFVPREIACTAPAGRPGDVVIQ